LSVEDARSDGGRSALLLGATGLVGSHCLDLLLRDPDYEAVHVLARREPGPRHPKLHVHLLDFDQLETAAGRFWVQDVICCLGTTIARAGSEQAFRRVDLDYPVRAAQLASEAAVDHFLVVSAMGADPNSRVFYNRVKGEMEEKVSGFPFAAVWVLRPSLLLGERSESRRAERIAAAISRPAAPLMVGPLRKYRPIHAADVARALVTLAKSEGRGGVVESDRIAELARGAQPLGGT
jgi:uncharacterized protein YbjT (DUF2867 family)